MAEDGKIKQRIELEGEKEYNSALNEARRNLKTLRSELKAETAELGNNASAQQKNEVRTKNLQKQIKEQEKVVKTYQDALKEVQEKYADNEDAIAKWEQKLNEARATLANMKNSITDVGDEMKSIETSADMGTIATNSFADSLGKIANIGDSVSSAIEDAFTSIVGHITDAISELWEQLMDVSARANNWTDIATMWNSNAATIQKWYHAVGAEAKDFSKLSGFVTKIVTGDQKKIAAASKVSAAKYTDQWEYAMAVMDSLSKMDLQKQIKALGNMGIKGAKQEGWIDMLKAWGDIQENAEKFDVTQGGTGLTQEELDKANTLWVAVAGIRESWQALKDHALVNLFGDISLSVTGNIQNIIDAFDEYFKAEDQAGRDAALKKIKENLTQIFTNIVDAIKEGIKMLNELAQELKSSDDATAQALGEILEKIVNGLQWFAKEENWKTVVNAFESIIGIWAAGRITSAIGNLAAFGAHIGTIGQFFGWGKGKTVTDTATTAASGASGGGWVTGISNTLNGLLPGVASWVGVNGGPVWDWLTHESPFAGLLTGKESVGDFWGRLVGDVQQNASTFASDWQDVFENNPIFKLFTDRSANKDASQRLNTQNWAPSIYGGTIGSGSTKYEDTVEKAIEEVVEYLDLEPVFSQEEKESALQDFFDAWREGADDLDSAMEWVQEVFGDEWDKVFEKMLEKWDELTPKQQESIEDIPSDWWMNNNELNSNIEGLRGVPGMMRAAVRDGVSGIKVYMDGQSVGNIVAPYVSEAVARDMIV